MNSEERRICMRIQCNGWRSTLICDIGRMLIGICPVSFKMLTLSARAAPSAVKLMCAAKRMDGIWVASPKKSPGFHDAP